jgi:hypothetical protein
MNWERKKLEDSRNFRNCLGKCKKQMLLLCVTFVLIFIGMPVFASKYDNTISKYDIKENSIRFKLDNNICVVVSNKEKEAILSDLKSGKFKAKQDSRLKSAIYFSNDFKNGKEYLYFGELFDCRLYQNQIIDNWRGIW